QRAVREPGTSADPTPTRPTRDTGTPAQHATREPSPTPARDRATPPPAAPPVQRVPREPGGTADPAPTPPARDTGTPVQRAVREPGTSADPTPTRPTRDTGTPAQHATREP
ncbi:hypothetical protein ADK87_11090, partial [Streptomyces sp. NRRL F-4711]